MTLFPCVWNWSARLSCMSENSLLSVCLKLFCKTALVKILPFQCLKLMCKTARLNILLFRPVWNWSARLHVWKFSSFVFEVDLRDFRLISCPHCLVSDCCVSPAMPSGCLTMCVQWWRGSFKTHFSLKLMYNSALLKILLFQCLKLICDTACLNILLFQPVWNWSARLHIWKFSSFVFEVDLWHCMSEYSSLSACLKLICKTAHLKILLFRVWSWSVTLHVWIFFSFSLFEIDLQDCTSENSPLSCLKLICDTACLNILLFQPVWNWSARLHIWKFSSFVFEVDLWHCMSEYSSLSACLKLICKTAHLKILLFRVWSWSVTLHVWIFFSFSVFKLICKTAHLKILLFQCLKLICEISDSFHALTVSCPTAVSLQQCQADAWRCACSGEEAHSGPRAQIGGRGRGLPAVTGAEPSLADGGLVLTVTLW